MATLKQSTAVHVGITMVLTSDHVSGATGKTLTIYATKAGGTPASITPTVVELDSTNMPGEYDLALTTSHTDTLGYLKLYVTATGCDPTTKEFDVTANILGDTMDANLTKILGTALTETAGQIAAAFKQFFNIASPTSTMNTITTVTTATNLTNAPTSGDFTSTMKTSLNAATPAVTVSDKTGFSLTAAYDDAKTAAQASDIPSASTIATAVWNALTSTFTTVGSAGKFILDNIDAAISSRLAATDYTAPDNADILLIKAKTDNLPDDPADESLIIAATDALATSIAALPTTTTVDAIKTRTDLIPDQPAAVSDIPTAIQNADALLTRDMSAVTEGAGRTPLQALRFIRNKWSIVSGILTVFKEDDATSSWTSTVTTDAAADPVITSDPS